MSDDPSLKNKSRVKEENIPVVILCGGWGTRLKEETEVIPKPLVKIGDKPILWHIMKIYSTYGFNDFILAVGYKGEKIKEYFLNYNALQGDFTIDFSSGAKCVVPHTEIEEKWKVTIIDTGLNTQTGGRLKRINPYIHTDTFFMTYGDGVADIDIDRLLKFHREHGKIATVTGVHPPARFGEIELANHIAVSFWEKPQARQGFINGGFFALNSGIFDLMGNEESLNFEKNVLPQLTANKELAVFCHEGYWQCMDTYRDMEFLNETWNKGHAPWKIWQQ